MPSYKKKPSKAKQSPPGMITLVVVDNPDVQKSLTSMLAEVDSSYRVYCSRNSWRLSSYDTDYTAIVSMKDEGLAKLASLSREVILAQTPDEVGSYEAYVVARFLRKNRVNVPVRRALLQSIELGSVLYGLLHATDMHSPRPEQYRTYEDRLVADRIASEAIVSVLGKSLPFELDLGLASLGLLSFICGGSRSVAVCGELQVTTPCRDGDNVLFMEKPSVVQTPSLDDFMWHYGMYRPWIGSVKAIGSAYASGAVSWPSGCSSRSPASGGVAEEWGIGLLENPRIMSAAAEAVRSEVEFLSGITSSLYMAGGYRFRVVSESAPESAPTLLTSEDVQSRSQYELAAYLTEAGVPSRNWAYSVLVLVRAGLIVQVGDTDFMATSNGRLVDAMAEQYLPELRELEFIKFAYSGFMDDSVDSVGRYEFMESFRRTLSLRVTKAGEDPVPLPEPARACPVCGSSMELRVTAAGTYLSCRKRSCEVSQCPARYSNYAAYPDT